MKSTHRLLLAAGMATASLLSAQSTPPETRPPGHGHRGPGGPGPVPPLIRALDTDRDGELSAAEIAGASAALRTLDTDGDGTVSAAELRPSRPADAPPPPADAGPRGGKGRGAPGHGSRPVPPLMLALDANGDGALQPGEIAAAAASLRALDANADGKLTRDELQPMPPPPAK